MNYKRITKCDEQGRKHVNTSRRKRIESRRGIKDGEI
jgi:hypothetical protein